ncbi:MAG: hypothetical protein WD428_02660 [Gaiellaceae bacterium]
MQKLLWAAALVALAAFPATARADGIAFAGTENARTGAGTPNGGPHYATLSLPKQTVVTKVGPEGAIFSYTTLPGQWGIPIVAFDGSKAGVSHNGKVLVLAQPPIGQMRKLSKFAVFFTPRLREEPRIVALRGSWSYDALSPDGKTLYLIEHVNQQDVSQYRVRAYNLESGRLLSKPIRDPKTGEIMHGYPVTRAASADGRWVYTLYQAEHHSFVHALDTMNRKAACIDVPKRFADYVGDARLLLTDDGGVLTVESRSRGTLAKIDTATHRLTETRAGPAATAAPDGMPWPALGAGVATLLAVLAFLVRRRLRPVPAVVADEGRDQPGEGEAGPHLDEQPRLVGSVYAGYESPDGDPDAGGESRQEEQKHGRLVPWTPDAHPEHVVGKSENGHNGSREHAREELLRRGGGPRGDAHDRRRQPGREHQPA